MIFTQEYINHAIDIITNFFEIDKEPYPVFVFLNTRKEMDTFCNRETQPYVVASSRKGKIGIFTPEAYEKESSHTFSEQKYQKLITHEICHYYQEQLTGTYKPVWLGEGLAVYLSEQYKDMSSPASFEKFLGYHNKGGKDVYSEAGFVAKKLLEKFGKGKVLAYIESFKEIDTPEHALESFHKIFGIPLSYDTLNTL